MCGGNSEAVVDRLDRLIADLSRARRLLADPDPIGALTPWLAGGQRIRAGWPPEPGPEQDEPVDRATLLALGRAGGWVRSVASNGQVVRAVRPG
jgi:prephenate dehydrogenase